MSQMKEIATALEELKRCRQQIESVEETLRQAFSGEEKKEYTLDEVRKRLVEKSKAGHTNEIKELLQKHGAVRLSDIPAAEYAALMKEADAIA